MDELFYKRSLYAETKAFLDAIVGIFPVGAPIDDSELGHLIAHLYGLWGAQNALLDGEIEAHIGFWDTISARSGSPYARACQADALHYAGREAEAIAVLTLALAQEAQLVEELDDGFLDTAQRLGGVAHLQFKLAVLRARLACGGDTEDDSARELYSELLEEFSSDGNAVEQIREVGRALEEAVLRGDMPRALVMRRADRDRS